ncbi:MAG: diguanylate cyclase [Candidatus Thiodiazotropha sp.]
MEFTTDKQTFARSPLYKHEAAALRLRFLTPLVAAIVLLVMVIAVSLFYFESESRNHGLIHQRLTRTQTVAKEIYEKSVINDANALRAMIDLLLRNQELAELFSRGDREALFTYASPIFKVLKRDYNVTHFYFTGADRVNLLRVHAPGRFGDVIDRVTTLRAEQSNTLSYGVELGPLGTFTLRVVSPWYSKQNGQFIGYIELGMEINHVIERLRNTFGYDVVVMINKDFLDRAKWQEGMKVLRKTMDWDQYPKVVTSVDNPREIPGILNERFRKGMHGPWNKVIEIENKDRSYWLLTMPIKDVRGRDVAEMSLLADVSFEMDVAERTALAVGITVFVLGAALIVFFSMQASRVSRRIEEDEKILEQLATQDSLTGLYTRRMFHEQLDSELARSKRFNHSMSLLLLDIDHFKQINDQYGHLAGDRVLQTISARLSKESRGIDYVCRYGGEELAIILPETGIKNAHKMAERMKRTISTLPFDLGDADSVSITISIGVATYPLHGDTETFLIAAADSALYDAKEQGRNRVCIYTPIEEGALYTEDSQSTDLS